MNILGVELELDVFDADVIEVCEREFAAVKDQVGNKENYKGMSSADGIRFQCRKINDFFDHVFGEGTAEKIFKGKSNIKDHMEAFSVVSNEVTASKDKFTAMVDKYTPNRAERRAEQKAAMKQHSKNFNRNGGYHGGKKN